MKLGPIAVRHRNANAPAIRRTVKCEVSILYVVSADFCVSGAGPDECCEHVDCRRFSCTVGSKEAEDFAFFDLEADRIDGLELFVAERFR